MLCLCVIYNMEMRSHRFGGSWRLGCRHKGAERARHGIPSRSGGVFQVRNA